MVKWIKSLLPLAVLVLSLLLIFLAFLDPQPRSTPDAGISGCFDDQQCRHEYREERGHRP